ncbi:MAG: sugar phosphate isomerase/epimerase [Verrucomicrobiaceae bacterium]|nr:MAG: sugar phosphate isomerase/epimerase [Verrucomicrobiaceae bacterium]
MSLTGSRRVFLKTGALALIGSAVAPRLPAAATEQKKLFSAMGIAAPLDKAAAMKAAGAEFLTASVGDFLVPDKSEEEFEKNLAKYVDLPLPILACNSFIRPPHLRCVGKEPNYDLILEWAETSFRRLKKANGKFIVFGSSGARQLRDGWPKEKADEQFVALLKAMGPLAEKHGVTVTIEQLRAEECNYINRISEGAALIRAAGHPNVRLLADLYHMASMGDTPADLKAAMDVVVHMEIAEKEGRTVPGVSGDDFRPYFRVLRETNYLGAMSIEGKWTDEQLAPAFKEIDKQASEV